MRSIRRRYSIGYLPLVLLVAASTACNVMPDGPLLPCGALNPDDGDPECGRGVSGGGGGGVLPLFVDIGLGAAAMDSAAFSPNPGSVSALGTVTWFNRDSVSHHIVSDVPLFDSGIITSTSQPYTIQVTKTGTFTYHCMIHPTMVGTIMVVR